MKAAFVVGFYDPVSKALDLDFKSDLDATKLFVFPKSSSHHAFDLSAFKAELLQRSEPSILIVSADFSRAQGFEWLSANVQGLRDAAAERGPKEVKIVLCGDTQNPAPVVAALREFGLGGPSRPGDVVPEHILTAFRGGGRVLCVRGKDQAEFEEALRRANFEFQNFATHFVEVVLPYGSNVGNTVKRLSKQHSCLIYAWGVLKYLPPAIKAKWGRFYTGESPATAVNWFKQAVLKPDTPDPKS